jgi:hypothetical protein
MLTRGLRHRRGVVRQAGTACSGTADSEEGVAAEDMMEPAVLDLLQHLTARSTTNDARATEAAARADQAQAAAVLRSAY